MTKLCKQAARLAGDKVTENIKGDGNDLVTNIDLAIEKFIVEKLQKQYPTFKIISEEFNPTTQVEQDYFVIDPIDGTVNFAAGLPFWGIQIAMIKGGKTIASAIYLPKLKEMYHADPSGAYCNRKKIHVNNKPIERSLFVLYKASPDFKRDRYFRKFHSSAVELSWLAAGIIGGHVDYDSCIWDFAPGKYLVEQAGGVTYYNYPNGIDGVSASAHTKEFLDLLLKETE